jgi:nucleoside-diphosphate-sugar epimerase
MASYVIFGCGFTGTEVARRALSTGHDVIATTRQEAHAAALRQLGIDARAAHALTRRESAIVSEGARVLVALPPDGRTDQEIAPELARARRVVYVSTTGVYGSARGHVDESTPVDLTDPRAALRLAAERTYLDHGATVVRAAGIYGPGRGLHRRLLEGGFRIPGTGSNVVSRIHVADLASMLLALLGPQGKDLGGQSFVLADDTPVPQIEVIRWLCQRLRLPLPPALPLDQVAATLRHDRSVDNSQIKRALHLSLEFPSYREGFAACLAAEGFCRED